MEVVIMFPQWEIMKRITDVGIVAVVRANSGQEAIDISKACLDGGIPAIEVTFTVPKAHKVIEELSDHFSDGSMIVGAGTVLDSETARIAILSGAQYIVSPHFDKDIALLCNTYKVPYMAGCMTITEIKEALSYGVEIVKIFPGSAFGPNYVKAVKGPLPQTQVMPTGGVSLDNVDEWIANGVVAVGVGGQLTKGTPEEITETAKKFVAKIKEARK
jgi:2-dehydro-3-deoxyphosphogluconate aldolase/(4S)-4-hydroxy-2-oxoglutarate aldolase